MLLRQILIAAIFAVISMVSSQAFAANAESHISVSSDPCPDDGCCDEDCPGGGDCHDKQGHIGDCDDDCGDCDDNCPGGCEEDAQKSGNI